MEIIENQVSPNGFCTQCLVCSVCAVCSPCLVYPPVGATALVTLWQGALLSMAQAGVA